MHKRAHRLEWHLGLPVVIGLVAALVPMGMFLVGRVERESRNIKELYTLSPDAPLPTVASLTADIRKARRGGSMLANPVDWVYVLLRVDDRGTLEWYDNGILRG